MVFIFALPGKHRSTSVKNETAVLRLPEPKHDPKPEPTAEPKPESQPEPQLGPQSAPKPGDSPAPTFESGSDRDIETLLRAGGEFWSSPAVNDFVPEFIKEPDGAALRAGSGYWIWPITGGASITPDGKAQFTFGWHTRSGQLPRRESPTPTQGRLLCRMVSSTSAQSSASFSAVALDGGANQGTFKLATVDVRSGTSVVDLLAFIETEPDGRSNLIAMSFFVDSTNRRLVPRGRPQGAHVVDELVRLERRSVTKQTLKIRDEPYDYFIIRLGLNQLPDRSRVKDAPEVAVWWMVGSRKTSADDIARFMDFIGVLARPGQSGTLKLDDSTLDGAFKRGTMTIRGTLKDERFAHMKDLFLRSELIAPESLTKAWRLDAGEIAFPVTLFTMSDDGTSATPLDGRYVGVALVGFDGVGHRLLSTPVVIDLGPE